MWTRWVAGIAALVAVSRVAAAQTVDGTARAVSEAQGLVGAMAADAMRAREALSWARAGRSMDDVRCTDEALSIADVTLRAAHDDLARLYAGVSGHDAKSWRGALDRLRLKAAASHEAVTVPCSGSAAAVPREGTTVTMHVASWVLPVVAGFVR